MKQISSGIHTVYIAESMWDKTRGVIGREYILDKAVYLIPSCNWVHTAFISRKIYIYFISHDYTEIISVQHLNSYCISKLCYPASHTLESNKALSKNQLELILSLIKEYFNS